MKKILTFLVIFLATVNVIMAQSAAPAQQPKLTYEIVVRDLDNNLVINQVLPVEIKLQNNETETVYSGDKKTNMNGMMVIDFPVPTDSDLWESPYQLKINVTIIGTNNENGADIYINKEIPVYAVPYALDSYFKKDSALTTPEIVRYGVQINVEDDVEPIIDAFWNNPANISGYLHDTVINYIKNQVGAARNLTLYFLNQADPDDVQDLYDAIPDDTKQMIAEKAGEKAKNHFDAAKEIAIYHIENATAEDIEGFMNTLESNENSKLIMAAAVDSVKEYIMTHDSVMAGIVKTAVDVLPLDNAHMNEAWNRVQANTPFYEAMKAILDTCIYSYLDTVFYAVSDSACAKVDICKMQEQIEQLRWHRHTNCPSIGQVELSLKTLPADYANVNIIMSDTFISNPHDVELTGADVKYAFICEYLNADYTPAAYDVDTVWGTYDATTLSFSATVPAADLAGRITKVTPVVFGLRCKNLDVPGAPDTIRSTNYECPAFASFTHTSPSGAESLGNNQGVALNAKLYSNYGNITDHGFVVVTAEGNDTLRNSTLSGLSFSDKIDMSYCGQTVTVYAFVKCGETSINSESSTFTLRGVNLDIVASATSWKAGDAAVELEAVNSFPISTPSLVNELGPTPTVEQIIAFAQERPAYAEYLTYLSGVQYAWEFPTEDPDHATAHTTSIVSVAPENAAPGSDATYKAIFTVTLFGANCSVTATVQIHRDND